jgi:uncharacterized protein (DUF362 family)
MVSKVDTSGKNLQDSVTEALKPLGGIGFFVKKGEVVFLKPNFNTADPFPASSDPLFLEAVISIVSSANPREIILGDQPTAFGNPRRYFQDSGARNLEKQFKNLKVIYVDDEPWVAKEIKDPKYLKKASIPSVLDKVDRVIMLPCLKTHAWAKYTGAIKLSVGFMKPSERFKMHAGFHLQEKIAELASLIKPDLVIMDARKCFVTKGPTDGKLEEPNLIFASESRVEIDIEGVKTIQSYKGNSLGNIAPDELPQIKRAIELGII